MRGCPSHDAKTDSSAATYNNNTRNDLNMFLVGVVSLFYHILINIRLLRNLE